MPKKKDIVDLPLITASQAGVFFGWSDTKFRLKFDQVLYKEIAVGKTAHKRGFLLTDVLRCAFPEASNHTIHIIAVGFLYRQADKRAVLFARNREKKEERGKDK